MMNCRKCGNEPKETDRIAWKCTSCGKAYGVKLSYLHKLMSKKNAGNTISLLKCKECGEYLDNGNEKIFWKCSCGNVQCGMLSDYKNKNTETKTQTKHAENRTKQKKVRLKIKYILPFSIICILLIVGILSFNIIRKNQKYDNAVNAYQNSNFESAKELFTSLGNFKDSKSMLLKTKIKIEESKDKTAPVIENLPDDIELYVGEGVDYKKWIKENNIKAIDDVDGEVDIIVDDTGIDYDTVSDYDVMDDYDTITVSATDKAGNIVTQTVDVFIGYYPTYDAYLTATNILFDDLSKDSDGGYSYMGINILKEETVSILFGGKKYKLDQGAMYRSLAMQLKGFYVARRIFYSAWDIDSMISLTILGFEKKNSWEEMKPYVDKASKIITSNDRPINKILRRLSKLNCVKGKFDFKNGKFKFTIKNLTKAAHQLGITEEMLGYVLALIDEYSDGASFSGNSYKLDMQFYGDKKYLR